MSSDTEGWYYASPTTVPGALQRGLGRGAEQVVSASDGPDLVAACLRRDYRWDPDVDERDVYLARLVRDLQMPVAPIIAQLHDAPPRDRDDDNAFGVALGVLEVLGRAGLDEAVEAVRGYVRHGQRWIEALETAADAWPVAWWDDLYPVISDRIDALAAYDRFWMSPPWTTWADRDERIAALDRPSMYERGPQRPFAGESTGALLALLRQNDRADDWIPALLELRRRPPEFDLVGLAEDLTANSAAASRSSLVQAMGPLAVPAARRWTKTDEHPLIWTGFRVLAAHGDITDAPTLVAGMDWLDARPDDLCGYEELAEGLARVGGPTAVAVVPRLRRLWLFRPRSSERVAYLRAVNKLDPASGSTHNMLIEGLWDCEADVRLLAVQQTPLLNDEIDGIAERLQYLRDDPVETPEVRAAATDRLA
jgi:hypothetical protein